MELDIFLQKAGVDKQEAAGRFAGRIEILEKFLLKFPEDAAYGTMLENAAQGKIEETAGSLHTLKGVTGNLGLQKLHQLSAAGVQYMRETQRMLPEADLEQIRQEYVRVVGVIREYRSEK